jgi:hypothetical protein
MIAQPQSMSVLTRHPTLQWEDVHYWRVQPQSLIFKAIISDGPEQLWDWI